MATKKPRSGVRKKKKQAEKPPAPPAKPTGREAAAKRMDSNVVETQRRIASAASARGLEAKGGAEPIKVAIPNLDGVVVTVPPARPVTASDVDARLLQLRHRHAASRPVGMGSRLERGDQVCVDFFGYHDGDLFTTSTGQWMILQPSDEVPGLFEGIEEFFVGEEKPIHCRLAEHYPDEEVSGDPVVFLVRVREAKRPELPSLDELLEATGAQDMESVREGVKQELAVERGQQLMDTAQELLMRELMSRTKEPVPKGRLDQALNALWREQEGDALANRNTATEDQDEARRAFLENEDLRAEMELRFFERGLLDAIIEREQIPDEQSTLLEALIGSVEGTTVSASVVHELMTGNHQWSTVMTEQLRDVRALEWLLQRVSLRLERADGKIIDVQLN